MSLIFKCKTGEAYYIKVLAELLANNLKTGCFEIEDTGITLRMFDHHRITLVDLDLLSENFCIYKFKSNYKNNLGLNLNHFHKMLKSIKKKDSLELFIKKDNINELGIKTIPKENTRITTSGIKIQNIQNLDIDIPTGYGKPVIVPSSEFQKMCKDLSSIGSVNIKIIAKNFNIEFIANVDGILKRKVQFGEEDEEEDEEDEENLKNNKEYMATFSTDQFSRVTKLSGLNNTMQIFYSKNLPLLFRSNVGSLGKISIYIKSKELIEKENNNIDDSDSDSD
jgi:proliferating cell nuclear antigen PCNA